MHKTKSALRFFVSLEHDALLEVVVAGGSKGVWNSRIRERKKNVF